MAVVISDNTNASYDGKLSTANGFYRVEAHNLRPLGNVKAVGTSYLTQALTFSNSGNLLGIALYFITSNTGSPHLATFTLEVQENVSGTWTTRRTQVLSYADITKFSPTSYIMSSYIKAIVLDTPLAVDTTSNKWRIQYKASVSGWQLATSDNTNLFYAAWCDNQVSFTSNDTLVVKDPVDIDDSVTFRGVYGTGSTADSTAVVVCLNEAMTDMDDACNLTVDTSAQRDIVFDGHCYRSAYAGFRVGTEASPVTIANRVNIVYQAYMTYGTNAISVWSNGTSLYRGKSYQFQYGEKPAVPVATLASDVNIGASTLTLNETPTSWANGDKIYIGKADNMGSNNATVEYTITGISGKDVSFTPAITLFKKLAGGHVANRSITYGINVSTSTADRISLHNITMDNASIYDGCKLVDQTFRSNNQSSQALPDLVSRSDKHQWSNSFIFNPSVGYLWQVVSNHYMGSYLSENILVRTNTVSQPQWVDALYNGGAGTYFVDDNIYIGAGNSHIMVNLNAAGLVAGGSFSRNIIENLQPYSYAYPYSGIGLIMNDNSFWGMLVPSAVSGSGLRVRCPFDISTWVGGEFKRNKFNKCQMAMQISGVMSGVDSEDNEFGTEVANTEDLVLKEGATYSLDWKNTQFASGMFVMNETERELSLEGSYVRMTDYDETLDDYRAWFRRGRTVNPSQGETLRQISSRADEVFENDYHISTKALTGYPISIFLNGQINNSAYYTGTHTLPKVSLLYDNGSEDYQSLTASTSEQAVQLDVTLTTDYNDLILRLATATDATDANAGVDFSDVVLKMRKYGKLFAEYDLGIKQTTDGYIAGLTIPQDNPFVTETDEATVAAYAGISLNGSAQTIVVTSTHTLAEIYDYSQYWATQNIGYDPAITTLDGTTITLASGWTIEGIENVTAGTKRLSGTIILSNTGTYDMTLGIATLEFAEVGEYIIYDSTFYEQITFVNTSGGAVTVWVLPDTNYVNSGPSITVEEYVAPAYVYGTISGLVAGSRLQIYNVTTDTEMVNAINAGTSYSIEYLNGDGYSTGDYVRIRAIKVDGDEATEFVEMTTIASAGGWSFLVEQNDDSVYNLNGIDGSTVTGVTIDDSLLLVSVDTGSITWQELYAYEVTWLFTEAGIRDEGQFTEAIDIANYKWFGFKIKNVTSPAEPLVISGGWGVDGDTGEAIDLVDTSGGTIFLAPDHVVAKIVNTAGTPVITGDISDIPDIVDQSLVDYKTAQKSDFDPLL